ncbi:MAG: glycosyltransferase family 4 protein [Candidatus Moranbacteria bacterium]|nr:glycosyltransferase family 4 protein [Candidatus Moranbacteria bacterium]MDD3964958.1 glycosyltransferase family 4 protein [Candidatus Moranbacteria bacterium]
MKILFLNYEYPPLGGGAGNATAYLFKEYAGIPDLEVHLVTSSADETLHHISVGKNITVHAIPIGKNGKNIHHQSEKDLLTYAWKGYRFADTLLAEGHFDAIHAFFTVPCGYMAMKLSKKHGVPYIVSLRGADVPGYSERFTLLYSLLRPLTRTIWARASNVVSNSSGLRTLALETNSFQEISIIPNGINIAEFKPDTEKEIDGYVRILCVSRLTPRKGINYLIEAMQILLTEDNERKIELWIAGEGDATELLKQQAKELRIEKNVKFFGLVKHDDLARYYKMADIFCLPSLNEGMSNTMLEALASGMPIVATVTGGTEELVGDGENGFYVEQKSSKDLAEKLEKLIGNDDMRKRFGTASRVRAEQMSWQNVAQAYYEMYQKARKE